MSDAGQGARVGHGRGPVAEVSKPGVASPKLWDVCLKRRVLRRAG